ncbi:MAG: hypothetical protein ACXAC7_05155 [Candidatus Hodarchaeales archaeon]|jgi:hypothetical protein
MAINGIPVSSQEIEEKCGTCRSHLQLKTFLNLTTRERIFAITCPKCRTDPIPVKSLKEYQNSSHAKHILPKKPNRSFITRKTR